MPRPNARAESLEGKPQRELDEAWKIVLTRDSAKVRATAASGIGRIELRMIESVRELRAELDTVPFVLTKLGVLEDGEVKVPDAVGANVGFGARIVAVAVIRARCEYRRIKPVGEPIIERTGSVMRQTGPDGAGTACIGNASVAQGAGAATDDDREAALECDDGIDSPPTNQLVRDSG